MTTIAHELETLSLCKDVCTEKRGVDPEVLRQIIVLAVELAREGREGRKIGTMFVVGDDQEVMRRSRSLILDPLKGHPLEARSIFDPDTRETLKELAQLDGAFVVSETGHVLSACRYLNASWEGLDVPMGLGSRHISAASITRDTRAVAVVVSESSMVRVFDDGELITEIIPEVWLLSKHSLHMAAPYSAQRGDNLTVVSKVE